MDQVTFHPNRRKFASCFYCHKFHPEEPEHFEVRNSKGQKYFHTHCYVRMKGEELRAKAELRTLRYQELVDFLDLIHKHVKIPQTERKGYGPL